MTQSQPDVLLYCRCTHMFYEHRPLDGPCLQCLCPEFRGTEYPTTYTSKAEVPK